MTELTDEDYGVLEYVDEEWWGHKDDPGFVGFSL